MLPESQCISSDFRYAMPNCASYDELESLYWQDMMTSQTIYPSADVDSSLCDETMVSFIQTK